jgi:hypothetical protein
MIDIMSKHNIFIICCSMSAIWLASTNTYCLHSATLHNISIAVAQISLVSSRANSAQKLISDNLFGHRVSESSGMQLEKYVEDDYGRTEEET